MMPTTNDQQADRDHFFRPSHFKGRHLFFTAFLMLLVMGWCSLHDQAKAGSMVYKDYVIRYDRGWDIMCEPYVVQKNDWVLKIFRQKGEIAHQNFRDFLGIFQRLNPHIKDVNMVRPGQSIDIPLRKLEHGTMPGQATGVVTIPFVTLAKIQDVVLKHSKSYRVRRGDTVSKLLARKYGSYGSKSYQEGVKLFQTANPQVTNLDRIFTGQKLYLPDPEIREKTFYASMYDEEGNLRQTMNRSAPAPDATRNAIPDDGPNTHVGATPEPAPEQASQNRLEQAAAAVEGVLNSKGTYYLPREGKEDFELDLSRHPMMTMPGRNKLLFTSKPRIMETEAALFEATWPDIDVVAYDENTSVTEIVTAILNSQEKQPDTVAELGFDDQAVHVAVRAKWVRPQKEQRHLAITPIAGPEEKTPESIRRYLEQNGITIKELLPSGKAAVTSGANSSQRHSVKNILAISAADQKEFVKSLARTLDLSYTPNISITFPYAGIQVQAYANLISSGDDRDLLVDFGDLYGDAVTALRKSGMDVLQITTNNSHTEIAKALLAALDEPFVENPTFLAAQRPAQYNTTITIWGLLYDKPNDKRILLAGDGLHPAVTDLLSATGIDVVVW